MASAAGAEGRRFDNINLLRAFAALSVVVYHVIVHSNWEGYPIAGPLVAFRIGWYGVDLFFVISGFVIAYSALILYRADATSFRGTSMRPIGYLRQRPEAGQESQRRADSGKQGLENAG